MLKTLDMCFSCVDHANYSFYGQTEGFAARVIESQRAYKDALEGYGSARVQIDCYLCGPVSYHKNGDVWIEESIPGETPSA